ncbi:methionine adenosyltransferase domain-containing protein [Candidatus Mycoplasma haematominutum]|uniref:methionine adenosyltransferase domain-containing protein n=1 Tax=Candidatus Mycoplasma haematominutum TaxID=209446 RepID=UPI001FDF6968|nr:methionine adenosyltransferase domain-containing protein [Candidatus Mycoplasma haematominutum]
MGRGHPDKIADLISDSILDELIQKLGMKQTRFSGEVLVSTNKIFFAGEGSSHHGVDFQKIMREILSKLGYNPLKFEFFTDYKAQSPELLGLNNNCCKVAGDQGILFGFACNETEHFLPLEYVLSKEITLNMLESHSERPAKGLKEDFKLLIHLEVEKDANSDKIMNSHLKLCVFSTHHEEGITRERIEEIFKEQVIFPVLQKYRVNHNYETQWLINPSGSFLIGGLDADSGVTNRKQIADSYGPLVRHGGGGLSGKDLTKIDRLGAYYLRWIAKNIVAAGLAHMIEIRATFAIAVAKALSFDITSSHDCKIRNNSELQDLISACFPTQISEIFEYLTSYTFEFAKLCESSHFGNFVPNLPWEQLNKVTDINDWWHQRTKKP